ncbi:hypothetical protein HKX48_008252 [Thoreauomyces humboldtii]|nr:hypothetical protein HKX48_008252 [Thoreauomyces humboldtii]
MSSAQDHSTASIPVKQVSRCKASGGFVTKYSHVSTVLGGCEMTFSVFTPPSYHHHSNGQPSQELFPVLYFLSGLTCTDDNFLQKAGGKDALASHGLVLVCPDTSPRGLSVQGDQDGSWDLGTGAGFYVDATEEGWKGYNMYAYVTRELPAIVERELRVDPERKGVFGHSMGGHGALVVGLREPERWRSVSAFAPIANPMECAWGKKAFSAYLGTDPSTWASYDSLSLLKSYSGPRRTILVDQGTDDKFLKDGQLLTERLSQARNPKVDVEVRMQDGYDHSYYFISSFVRDHVEFHAKALKA